MTCRKKCCCDCKRGAVECFRLAAEGKSLGYCVKGPRGKDCNGERKTRGLCPSFERDGK